MNPTLLKGLIGVGAAGSVTAVSVGGYFLSSKPSFKTIRERLKDRTPLKFYSGGEEDNDAKSAWTEKVNSYNGSDETDAVNLNTFILENGDALNEVKFSNKCKEILAIKWDKETEDLKQKEAWASYWCFAPQ